MPKDFINCYQRYYASNILFVLAVSLSKASVACFLLQLTPVAKQQRFIHVLLGITIVWGLTFFLAVAFACDLPSPWIWSEQRCPGYVSLPKPLPMAIEASLKSSYSFFGGKSWSQLVAY